ncbi:MAG: hypothetical protein IPF82_14995 [Blastocatellia bacterium]|nr:hypothetical protein [Blastocatellia bacterium]
MTDESIRQRRDGTVLCVIEAGFGREAEFLPSADASSSAFAFAARLRPSLSRDDDAIAAAWAARAARRALGNDGVREYDERGTWTRPMDEAFAHGFVAFLRGAAWGGPWPPEAANWRTQLAATMASCPDGHEGREVAQALDDPVRALYGRLVVLAAKLGALPFGSPELAPHRPYADPESAGGPATFRKQSSTVGPSGESSAASSSERPAPAVGFSTLDEPRPQRFLVPALVVAAVLVLVIGTVGVLYFTVFRPSARDAERASEATIEQLRSREFSKIYDNGSAFLRRERWPEFGARVKRPESLGKMLEVTQQGPARIDRVPGFGRTATVNCDATYVFGNVSFICRYVDVGFVGEWRLAEFDAAVRPEFAEPPFEATPDGADALARRVLFAFQQSDYATIESLIPGIKDRERIQSFRNTLLGDGFITKFERTSLAEEEVNGIVVQAATYTIETNRDKRSGTLKFLLVRDALQWRVGGMETNMSFRN